MPSIEYYAGLFDGEGYVRIDNHHHNKSTGRTPANIRYNVNCGIAMTYGPIIQSLQERWGGYYYADDSFQRKYAKNRVIHRWVATSMIAHKFLKDVQPFTVVKREQVDIAVAFQEHILLHKPKMLGFWKDPVGLQTQEEFKAVIFAERKAMCDRIRALKKENFPLVAGDP